MGCIYTQVCAADEDELLTDDNKPCSTSTSTSSNSSINVFAVPRFSRTATTIFTLDPIDLQPCSPFQTIHSHSSTPTTANLVYYGGGIPGVALDEETVESCVYTGAIPEGYTSAHHHVRWGVHTRAGTDPMRRRKENQDAYCIADGVANEGHVLWFSVFDGHGPNGAFASHFAREKYQESIATAFRQQVSDSENNYPASIGNHVIPWAAQSVMEQLQTSALDISVSGTTAVGLLVVNQDVFVANIGDSRVIIAVYNEQESIYTIAHETKDHKPEIPEEKERIEAHNGRVFEWGTYRVWLADVDMPGLAMSRSFGDSVAHTVGVTSEPDVTYIDQIVHREPEHPSFAILASDGVWEFMTSEEVMTFVSECILVSHMSPQQTCDALVAEATERWKDEDDVIDDITAIVIYF